MTHKLKDKFPKLQILMSAACLVMASSVGNAAAQTDDTEDHVLEEIIVNEDSVSQERRPNTGRLNLQPIAVQIAHHRPLLSHDNIQLIIRPVRLGTDDVYEEDTSVGRRVARVNVSLNHEGVRPGTRIKRPDLGHRSVDLPTGLYAVTEIRYEIGGNPFANVGNTIIPGPLPPIQHHYCLAEQTIAFDVREGEVTDVGRLILHGLERRYGSNKHGHRPFLAADAAYVPISDPAFRNKAPEAAAAGVIAFDPDNGLCRRGSKKVPGWFEEEEFIEAFPTIVISSNGHSQQTY